MSDANMQAFADAAEEALKNLAADHGLDPSDFISVMITLLLKFTVNFSIDGKELNAIMAMMVSLNHDIGHFLQFMVEQEKEKDKPQTRN